MLFYIIQSLFSFIRCDVREQSHAQNNGYVLKTGKGSRAIAVILFYALYQPLFL